MADSKISDLTAATLPLDGTELLPVVQGGVSKKATVADLGGGATTLDDLTDVNTTGASSGEVLTYDGSDWVPASGGGSGSSKDLQYNVPSSWVSVDEFNDDSLDSSWVRVDASGGAGRAVWTESADVLSVLNLGGDGGGELHAMMRPLAGAGGALATGDAFVTHITLAGVAGFNYVMGGLIFSDGVTPGAGTQVITLMYSSSVSAMEISTRSYTGFNTGVDSGGGPNQPIVGMYERLVYLGSNNWRTDISPDGVSWIPHSSVNYAITPTHVGMFISSWGTSTKGVASYQFIRRMSGVS